MLVIRVDFPAGRYHATPWGSHVNEGAVEWPPSPWRLFRALISVGFTHLHWGTIPGEAVSLFEKLAGHHPEFLLPRTVETHTRHYMPVHEGATVKSAKIFDTSVRIADERPDRQPLWIRFHVDLENGELPLLRELCEHLGWLGRAESWVDASLSSENPPEGTWCKPANSTQAIQGHRLVRLLSPIKAEQYSTWRTTEIDQYVAEHTRQTESVPNARQLKKIEAPFPVTLMECLICETPFLQKHGWSQPPGSQWIDYAIPISQPPRVRRKRQRTSQQSVGNVAILALSSDSVRGRTLPKLTDTLLVAEKIHQASVAQMASVDRELVHLFSGQRPDGSRLLGHQHAHFVPLAIDGTRKQVDHVLVYIPIGLTNEASKALAAINKIYSKGLPTTFVSLIGVGNFDEIATRIPKLRRHPMFATSTSRTFVSSTPFVPSRHLRRKYQLAENIADECRFRDLPEPTIVPNTVHRNAGDYRIARVNADRQPPRAEGYFLKIRFDADVPTPFLVLGYGSHFGLGQFVAAN